MTEQIGILIKNLDNALQRYASREAKQLGVTQVQMSIIDFIYRNEDQQELYQTNIEHEFNIQKSSATALLQLMGKKQLIVRTPSQHDSRYKMIILTPKARKFASGIRQFFDQTDDQLRSALGNEADQFISSLQQLRDYMEKQLQ